MSFSIVGHEVPIFRAAIGTIVGLLTILQGLITYDYTQEKALNDEQQVEIIQMGRYDAAQMEWMKSVDKSLISIDNKLNHIDEQIDELQFRPGPVQGRNTTGLATSQEIRELRADVKRLYDYLAPQRR